MADEFGTAIYTNCAPGQGVEGVGGMQFQSHSPEVGHEALALIRRHLIYEPPEQLIRERQAIEAFPPSFAHAYENGIYATGAGVYVGREADGTRPGNHLTHAIVTTDPGAYRSLRPAQLFRAPFWRTQPAPTTQSDPVGESWEPGPLDAAEVARFVNAQPDGVELLAALLTYLRGDETTAKRRILLISREVEPVLYWLTAATLLIPLPEALRIGFKVFTADPARSAMPVVAVHPDWTRSVATVEDDRGYAVFDLPRNDWTKLPGPSEARHWARLLCEADPYDLSETVELAAASGLRGSAARELASAAVLGQTPSPGNANELAGWLRTGPAALREAYSGKLISALTRLQDRGLMRRIDDITRVQYPERNYGTTLNLLRLELEYASKQRTPSWPTRDGRPGPASYGQRSVSAAEEAEAAQLVTHYLRKAQGAAFDAVLRVSAQFGVSVPLAAVREAAAGFAAHWADNPTAGYDPRAWPQDFPVQDMLRDELSDRILRSPSSGTIIADAWWDRLPGWEAGSADITSPLQRELLSAAMAHSGNRPRLRIAEAHLGRIRVPAGGAHYRELSTVLWARTRPTLDEFHALNRLVPPDTALDPALFTGLIDSATSELPGLSELDLCDDLAKKHLFAPDAATQRVLDYHHELRFLESRLAAGNPPQDIDKFLRRVPPFLLNAHGDRLTGGLLAINDPVRVVNLVGQLPQQFQISYLRAWHNQDLATLRHPQIAVCFTVVYRLRWGWAPKDSPLQRELNDLKAKLVADLGKWCRHASADDTREVGAFLPSQDTDLVNSWNAHVARNRPGPIGRLRVRWENRQSREQPTPDG